MPFVSNLKSLKSSTFFNVVYNDDFTMPMHKHSTYELLHVKRGSMQLCYKPSGSEKFSTLTLVNHQFVLININVPHKLIIPQGMSCHLLNIEFYPASYGDSEAPPLGEIVLSTDGLNECESVKRVFGEYFSVAVADDSDNVEQIVESLHGLMNDPTPSFENKYLCDLFLSQLIIAVSRCKCADTLNIDGNLYIRKAMAYIEQNYQNEIRLDDIADYTQVNKAYLERLVKSQTGKTLCTIIQEYRIRRSCQLLLKSVYSIEDIGAMVGFKNRRTFTKNFIKFRGVSPQKFKIQNKDKSFRHYDNYAQFYIENDGEV